MMEKNLTKILVIILAISIVIAGILLYVMFRNNEFSAKILAEKIVINNGWTNEYYGTVIYSDGSIYDFVIRDPEKDIDTLSLEERSEYILANASKRDEKVEKEDLKRIKKDVSKIERKYTGKDKDYDLGVFEEMSTETIKVYDHKAKDIVILRREGGRNPVENVAEMAQELIEIISKYIIIYDY